MSKRTKATITLSGGGKSVTIDADTFAGKVKARMDELGVPHRDIEVGGKSAGTQQSFGFDTTHGFLGEEFILWLWFRWEIEGGEFPMGSTGSLFTGKPTSVVGIAIDDLVVFAAPGQDETQQTLRHGLPTRTAEARQALRSGHRVAKARLIVAEGSRQWTVTLDGARMSLGSVKLPEDDVDCESAIDRTVDRAANWLALHEIVSVLYGQFLRVRVGAEWKQESQRLASWMQGGAS